jgi:ABC-type Fe3+/spermidine/putrescine transport system ATPase subunit
VGNTVLEFSNVVKHFEDALIVDGISFTVSRGEFFTLLGPSGCGKTTTLRLLAGLEDPDAGEIVLEGRCLAAPERDILVPPDKRGIGMMFQSYAIWPHMTVFENVAFPLRVRRIANDVIKKRVLETLHLVGLGGMEQRGATQLSGGQQQRVALARAIVHTPSLLLLDEPLSNLDVKLREQMRNELRALQTRLNLAVVYVTHDQDEALAMSDRIAVLNKGRIEQIGTPMELYEQPRTRFVSEFLGRAIILTGTVRTDGGHKWIHVHDGYRIAIHGERGAHFSDGDAVRLLSRPEDIVLLPGGEPGPNQVGGTVERIAYMGNHLEYIISAAGRSLVLSATKKERHDVGAQVRLGFDPASIMVMPQ